MSGFHSLEISDVRRETRDAIVLTLDVPEELRERFRFKQGQFLTFEAPIGEDVVRRSYSICSGAHEGALRVAIKRVPGGLFSSWAHETLAVGTRMHVSPPDGSFHIAIEPERARRYLGFAAGSGITPMLSTIATMLAAEPTSSFTLIYGNRASSSMMFREELLRLKDRYLDRLALIFVMSREQQDIEDLHGRIDREKCERLFARWIDLDAIDTTFICGPEDMTRNVIAALTEHGIERSAIKTELFGTSTTSRRIREVAPAVPDERTHVSLTFEGARRDIEMPRTGESILDAALRNGIDIPYSCRSGVCGTCRARIIAGDVDIDTTYALEDYELARGATLLCQSYPVSASIAIDVDSSLVA